MNTRSTIIRTALAVPFATCLTIVGGVAIGTAAGAEKSSPTPRIIITLAPAFDQAISAKYTDGISAVDIEGKGDRQDSPDALFGDELLDDFSVVVQPDLTGPIYLLELPASTDVPAVLAALRRLPMVDRAALDDPVGPFSTDADTRSPNQAFSADAGHDCLEPKPIDGDADDAPTPESDAPDDEIDAEESGDEAEDLATLLEGLIDFDIGIDDEELGYDDGDDSDEDSDDESEDDPEETDDGDSDTLSEPEVPEDVNPDLPAVPAVFALEQNYPNPFNPCTTIRYALPRGGDVLLTVYDVLGQRVAVLVDGPQDAGEHSVVWDGRDDTGEEAASGMYLYRLEAEKSAAVKKMVLVK